MVNSMPWQRRRSILTKGATSRSAVILGGSVNPILRGYGTSELHADALGGKRSFSPANVALFVNGRCKGNSYKQLLNHIQGKYYRPRKEELVPR